MWKLMQNEAHPHLQQTDTGGPLTRMHCAKQTDTDKPTTHICIHPCHEISTVHTLSTELLIEIPILCWYWQERVTHEECHGTIIESMNIVFNWVIAPRCWASRFVTYRIPFCSTSLHCSGSYQKQVIFLAVLTHKKSDNHHTWVVQ